MYNYMKVTKVESPDYHQVCEARGLLGIHRFERSSIPAHGQGFLDSYCRWTYPDQRWQLSQTLAMWWAEIPDIQATSLLADFVQNFSIPAPPLCLHIFLN